MARSLEFGFGMRRIEKKKYKVGDEVMVKARITSVFSRSYTANCSCGNFYITNEDILQEPQMTAEEAWEIAKKIADMLCEESNEIFGTAHLEHILQRNTPQEAKAKIEEWEAAKEIKVGDEVGHDGEIGVVTNTDDKAGFFNVLFKNGKTAAYKSERLKKTGRRIDITGLLNQIGGDK